MNWLERSKQTLLIRLYTWRHIRLLWWTQPSIIEKNDQKTVFEIPLTSRTKNHLGSMYFGALAMGAEAAIALTAIFEIYKTKRKVDFIFKDFSAEFLKRAEGDTHFVCEQGLTIAALIHKAIESKQRETASFQSFAVVPSKDPLTPVAQFKVTLSVKLRE